MKQNSTLHLTGGTFFLIFIFIQGALSKNHSRNPWLFGYTSLARDVLNSAMDSDVLNSATDHEVIGSNILARDVLNSAMDSDVLNSATDHESSGDMNLSGSDDDSAVEAGDIHHRN